MEKKEHRILERSLVRLGMLLVTAAAAVSLVARPVFAQTTYRITDGSRVLIHTTTLRDTEAVLGEAGLALGAADTYTTRQQPREQEIHISRGKRVIVDHYGNRREVISRGEEQVWQLLERLDIDWSEGDLISAPLDMVVYDGLELSVALVTTEIQTYTALLPYETVRCGDPSLPLGREQVLIPGRNGQMTCTALVTDVNGEEQQRQILSETVTVQPVVAVVAVGTGQAMKTNAEPVQPVIGNGIIHLPTGEVVTYTERITSLATAYCDKGLTATGTQARVGAIAVDPDYIPYGTRMFIMTLDGEYVYGIATAEDCGSKEYIHDTRIDLHFDTYAQCRQFGARWCHVYILG